MKKDVTLHDLLVISLVLQSDGYRSSTTHLAACLREAFYNFSNLYYMLRHRQAKQSPNGILKAP